MIEIASLVNLSQVFIQSCYNFQVRDIYTAGPVKNAPGVLGLKVEGVGVIGLPLSNSTINDLIKV
jgi:hypothetical protein